jgi:hypothetical protein
MDGMALMASLVGGSPFGPMRGSLITADRTRPEKVGWASVSGVEKMSAAEASAANAIEGNRVHAIRQFMIDRERAVIVFAPTLWEIL